jgi:hypothetical protein
MYRTPSSAGNRRTHTFSVWLKRANLDSSGFKHIFSRSEASYFYGYYFYQDKLTMGSGSASTEMQLRTNRLFRDPAAWYHLVLILDTTQAVASERARMYINGVREFGDFNQETYPSLNAQLWMNTTSITEIGVANPSGVKGGYFDGYMTDIYFLDGYAYGPEYFGEFDDSDNWIPKEYEEGNYGTNGFKFTGADSSSFGTDESGTGNNFTVAGLAAHDQVTDTPTNNFAVLNPIDKGSNTTLADGNLEFTSSADGGVRSSIFLNANKYYVEAIVGTYGNAFSFGIANPDRSLSADSGTDLADFYGWYINPTQNWIASGSNPWNTGSNSASGSLHVLQMAIDRSDTSSIKLYAGINNTYYNSSGGTDGNPSSGSNPTATITGGEEWSIGFWNRDAAASNIFVNFGQEGTFGGNKTAGGNSDANGIGNFFHSVPTGFKALCTKNLFSSGG